MSRCVCVCTLVGVCMCVSPQEGGEGPRLVRGGADPHLVPSPGEGKEGRPLIPSAPQAETRFLLCLGSGRSGHHPQRALCSEAVFASIWSVLRDEAFPCPSCGCCWPGQGRTTGSWVRQRPPRQPTLGSPGQGPSLHSRATTGPAPRTLARAVGWGGRSASKTET